MADRMWDAYSPGFYYSFSVKAPDKETAERRARSLEPGVTVRESHDELLPLAPVWPPRYRVDWT